MAKLNFKKLSANALNRGFGSAIGGAANPMLDKIVPATFKPMLKSVLKVAVGALVPEFVPKIKIATHVGSGLIGAAVSDYLRDNVAAFSSNAASGIGEDLDRGYIIDEDLAGLGEMETLSGEEEDTLSSEDEGSVVLEGDEETVLM